MNGLRDIVAMVNGKVNDFVWALPMLVLLVGTGILMTVLTKGFQLSHFRFWMAHTVGAIFKNKHVTAHTAKEDRSISQFQSLCTALAATIGTGNIAGVAAAIAAGGPGAIFWMWIVAIFGMMTNFSENVLGIYYRRKNAAGEWSGGAMYYLRDGLGSFRGCKQLGKVLALLFSIFCILASFGIGNMGQINSIATNMRAVFSIPWATGSFTLELEWTMTLEPRPASLENTPRFMPQVTAAFTPLPTMPPPTAFMAKAPLKMEAKAGRMLR